MGVTQIVSRHHNSSRCPLETKGNMNVCVPVLAWRKQMGGGGGVARGWS